MDQKEMDDRRLLLRNAEKRPLFCPVCNGVMVFKGLGTYVCENCKETQRDDYGKVREYLEKNPGATILHVSEATGVSKQSIRQLLRDSRIQIADNNQRFLRCDRCNDPIPFGTLCPKCEALYHQKVEESLRSEQKRKMQQNRGDMRGVSTEKQITNEGAIRFNHDNK